MSHPEDTAELGDFDVEVAGVPMPAWLMSMPSSVVDVHLGDRVVTFEQLFSSLAWTCTWPRYACMLTRPDPQNECGYRLDDYDEEALKAHAMVHLTE